MLFRSFVPIVLLLSACGMAQAKPKATGAPLYCLGEVSSSQTDMDAFAVEVARELNAYTAQTQFEACANLCKRPDGTLAASLITSQAHAFCPMTTLCPSGSVPTGQDIHSHIGLKRYTPNAIDRLSLVRRYGLREQVSTTPGAFSDGDYAGGAGYMTHAKAVLHQAGKGRARVVWSWRDDTDSPSNARIATPCQ